MAGQEEEAEAQVHGLAEGEAMAGKEPAEMCSSRSLSSSPSDVSSRSSVASSGDTELGDTDAMYRLMQSEYEEIPSFRWIATPLRWWKTRKGSDVSKMTERGTGRQLTMEEFHSSVNSHFPAAQQPMRWRDVEDVGGGYAGDSSGKSDGYRIDDSGHVGNGFVSKMRRGWLESIKTVAGTVGQRTGKCGRGSSSATDDRQEAQLLHAAERVRVRHRGKSRKGGPRPLFMSQEVKAHEGAILCIQFSLDGRYLASAGEDAVIHIWQVVQMEKAGLPTEREVAASSTEFASSNPFSIFTDVFALSEEPVCSFAGHGGEILDLSWSLSGHLLSSSTDKTVRLWHLSSNCCLKTFSHNNYVTCVHFNPVDDDYFISGSIDGRVRIWSARGGGVVDWVDGREIVTAARYRPDGQGALVGSLAGRCHFYDTPENKLHLKAQIFPAKTTKKLALCRILGFLFVPGSSSEVVVTRAHSGVRVLDGMELVRKFEGTLSPMSAPDLTADGRYLVCASEDSRVYVWPFHANSRPNRGKSGVVATTRSYEYFDCEDVSAAVAWPGDSSRAAFQSSRDANPIERAALSNARSPVFEEETQGQGMSGSPPHTSNFPSESRGHAGDLVSATGPEETPLAAADKQPPRGNGDLSTGGATPPIENRPAGRMVIVTAGFGGRIKVFQNFASPLRI